MSELTEEEQTIEDLRDADIDLAQPHKLEHYLSFPFAAQANAVGEELRQQGYLVVVDYEEDDELWVVVAGHEVPISVRSLSDLRSHFERIAFARGGEYVCWNVVVPDEDYDKYAEGTE
jgi:regulator of ribonuclease activity B